MMTLFTRRRMLQLGLVVPIGILVACKAEEEPAAQTSTTPTSSPSTPESTSLAPTPTCDDGDGATPEQTEGPYFTPNSPERTSLLEAGMAGAKFTLTGTVVSTACTPVANALVDFWHANDAGEYDNVGYTLRGHQFTDAQGRYSLQTIMPGIYTGRTRHIHVKVQAPNNPILTTQLYFPNEPGNASDSIFREECLIDLAEAGSAKTGAFQFVLDV